MRTIDVPIAGRTVTVTPLRGLKRIKAFDDAMRARLGKAHDSQSDDPAVAASAAAGLLFDDLAELLRLGAPDIVTDELLDNCTADEAVALFRAIAELTGPLDQIEGKR